MSIALIGASGRAGSEILKELVRRGHAVTAIARNAANIPELPGVTALAVDAQDGPSLAEALKGHDVVISAIMFATSNPLTLVHAVKSAGAKRYLVVGGAGSLEVAPGLRLIDTPQFPRAYMAEATAGALFLDLLRKETELDWTFLSPAAMFVEGPRKGTFRLGADQFFTDADGKSEISFADYAIAMADEIETPKHSRKRFSVAY